MPGPYKGFDLGKEPQSAPNGKNHLLVIAIDEYAHCPKLNNCVKDAQDFVGLMLEKYRFESENITTLYNAEATRAGILSGLKALKKQVGPEDNLLLYFSGHGEVEDGIGYWVPVEARPANEWEFVATSDIKARLNAINSFHTFVIVDACFSGSLFATYRSVRPGYEHKRSRWGLAASHSRERVLDDQPGENSPFAEKLLKLLRDNAEDIGVQKLATEVIEAVQAATRGKQVPVFKPLRVKGDDSGQYVFRLKQQVPTIEPAVSPREKERPTPSQPKPQPPRMLPLQGKQPPNGAFTDPRDGQVYRTVEINGLRWMAQNLNFDVGEGCWFYDDDPKNSEKYGRLYTWEAAQKACLFGWRLPTDEEWKALANCFGGYGDGRNLLTVLKGWIIDGKPKESYEALIVGGNSGFAALLAGYRGPSGNCYHLGVHGTFWSETEKNAQTAWNYYFHSDGKELSRTYRSKSFGFSCRCVQDWAPSAGEAFSAR